MKAKTETLSAALTHLYHEPGRRPGLPFASFSSTDCGFRPRIAEPFQWFRHDALRIKHLTDFVELGPFGLLENYSLDVAGQKNNQAIMRRNAGVYPGGFFGLLGRSFRATPLAATYWADPRPGDLVNDRWRKVGWLNIVIGHGSRLSDVGVDAEL